MASVPVLMYHHVNPNMGDMITVTPEVFEAQMRYIKGAGYRTLCLDELASVIEGRLRPREKCTVITFDDGYLDNYAFAYPILKYYGLKAVVFIVTDWVEGASINKTVNKKTLMEDFRKKPPLHNETKELTEKGLYKKVSIDWDMAREMQESGLIEFHSHTITHRRCDKLTKEELTKELFESKKTIEERLEANCEYLCWPKGKYTPQAIEAAKQAGYKGLFTTENGVVKPGEDPFHIKRIVVKDKVQWFKTRLKIYTSPLWADIYTRIKKA